MPGGVRSSIKVFILTTTHFNHSIQTLEAYHPTAISMMSQPQIRMSSPGGKLTKILDLQPPIGSRTVATLRKAITKALESTNIPWRTINYISRGTSDDMTVCVGTHKMKPGVALAGKDAVLAVLKE